MRRVPGEPSLFRKSDPMAPSVMHVRRLRRFSLGGGEVVASGWRWGVVSIKRRRPMNTVSWLRNGKQSFEMERSLCVHAFGGMGATNVQI